MGQSGNIQQLRSRSEGVSEVLGLALSQRKDSQEADMCSYLITLEFDDGQLSTTQYSSSSDVKTKLAEVVNDLTDEDGIEHFRSITITQAA
jgi:metal-responsive CopG/Arc/MetJ family transcriptional regulator